MGEMGALFKFGHPASENVTQKGDGTQAWAAMLLKNYRNYPVKKGAGVGWFLTILPAFLLFHACQFLGHTAIWFRHANPDIDPNVRAIGFRDVYVCGVYSPGFPGCRLTVSWERHGLLRGGYCSRGFDIFHKEVP